MLFNEKGTKRIEGLGHGIEYIRPVERHQYDGIRALSYLLRSDSTPEVCRNSGAPTTAVVNGERPFPKAETTIFVATRFPAVRANLTCQRYPRPISETVIATSESYGVPNN